MTWSSSALSDTAEDFYRGKTVTIVVGVGPGGGYDQYARLAGAHLGRHIPGQPNVIVQNMPGGGQTRATLYAYNAAPKDGTVLLAVLQAVTQNAALDTIKGVDPEKFNWIGRMTSVVEVGVGWRASGIETIEDARKSKVIAAGTVASGSPVIMPSLLNKYAGTQFRIVRGYDSSAKMLLALEQGEAQVSLASWPSLKAGRTDLLREKKISVIYQVSLKRHPDLPNTPTVGELAQGDAGKAALRFFASSAEVGRSLVAPPGVPADRVRVLRDAFNRMAKDPAVLADAKKRNIEFDSASGEELTHIVAETLATPKDVVDQLKEVVNEM
jgi:tripartite-type tricarboxylate transporter receptor subunit TctC